MGGKPSRPEDEIKALREEVETLRARLELFQAAVDALPFPMFWKDANSVYVGANVHQAARAGLSAPEELVGLSDADLPESDEGDPRPADERISETHIVPLKSDAGQVMGEVGWSEDITDREAQRHAQALLDERLRQAHKLDSLGALAGGIAHDFNNILASIMANLWLVEQTLADDHEVRESLTDIHRGGMRAKALVAQILTLSRRQTQQLGAVSVGAVVEEACRLLRATIPAGIAMAVTIDPDVPMILADSTQLHQIVMNLCTNAWHAIEDRPSRAARIEVHVSWCALDAAAVASLASGIAPGAYVVLSVRDNGVGMDPATSARIFEPFFTTRTLGRGTGLGLAVVHGIVTAHRGAIEVESVPRLGTSVRVYFPPAPVQRESSKPDRAPPLRRSSGPPCATKHVLYVDDELDLVSAVTRILDRERIRVTAFADPREALAALRADPDQFDVLATDFNMPHLSGLDLAREAAALCPSLPVIIASGYVTAELRAEAEKLGVRRVLNKVELATDLREAVLQLLQET